jgi:chromate transporter
VQQWFSDRQFSESFALAQLTPGPNVILVTLIGYHVAGILAAVVATFAMCGPTSVLAFLVGGASERFRGSRWHLALSRGLVPVTLGLTASSATATGSDYNWAAVAIIAGAALTAYFARVHPLWTFAAAALLGLIGLV